MHHHAIHDLQLEVEQSGELEECEVEKLTPEQLLSGVTGTAHVAAIPTTPAAQSATYVTVANQSQQQQQASEQQQARI